MKVYVAVLEDIEGEYVEGIFSSLEKAVAWLKEKYSNPEQDYSIYEYELDNPDNNKYVWPEHTSTQEKRALEEAQHKAVSIDKWVKALKGIKTLEGPSYTHANR